MLVLGVGGRAGGKRDWIGDWGGGRGGVSRKFYTFQSCVCRTTESEMAETSQINTDTVNL